MQGSFAPSNPIIYLNKDLEAKCGKNWTQCAGAPPELPSFSPFTYSLDIMLPVLDLGQKHDWQPIDRPGKPVIMVFPSITWEPGYDLPSDVPHIRIDERPLAEGTVDKIVRVQTMLSWGVLGLLHRDAFRADQEGLKASCVLSGAGIRMLVCMHVAPLFISGSASRLRLRPGCS